MRRYNTIYLALFIFTICIACSEEQIISPIASDDIHVTTEFNENSLSSDENFSSLVSLLNSTDQFKKNHVLFTQKLVDLVIQLDSKYLANATEEQKELFTSVLEKSLTINLKESSKDAYALNETNFGYNEINFGNMEYVKAPIHQVWSSLVDDNSYESWNVFNQEMNTMFNDNSFTELNNQTEINWSTNVVSDYWFKSNRKIAFETVGSDNMVLSNEMKYSGVLASFYYHLTNETILNNFEELTDGLKTKVEV